MARSTALRRVSTTAGIGALVAISALAALFAFLALLFGLFFGWLARGLLAETIVWAIAGVGVVVTCVILIQWAALRSQPRVDSD